MALVYQMVLIKKHINRDGLVWCKALTCLNISGVMPYTFYCYEADGLKYTAVISGTDLSTLQTNSTETAIKYKTNTLTINNDGVLARGASFSYMYDNGWHAGRLYIMMLQRLPNIMCKDI